MSIIGKHCVIRTYSAGVHVGTVAEKDGKEVTLTDARRLWYWEGAFTLSAVATSGVKPSSKMSAIVPEIVLTEAIEIIPTTEAARASFDAVEAHHARS